MSPIERALAEQACMKLQTLYCVRADQGDVEGFTALFAPDGWIKVPEHPAFAGHDAIRASMRALAASGVTMRHLAMNCVVDIERDDAASGLCYLVVFNSAAPADENGWRPMDLPATVGQYEDRFVRIDDLWLFSSRTLTRVFRRMDDPILTAARAARS